MKPENLADKVQFKLPSPWRRKFVLQDGVAIPGTTFGDQEGHLFASEILALEYGDLEAALDAGTTHPAPVHRGRWPSLGLDGMPNAGWHGNLPGEGTVAQRVKRLLLTGMPEQTDRLRGMADEVVRLVPPVAFGRRKAFRSSLGGDDLDIGRYLAGDTDFWVDYNRSGKRPSPYITIVCHYGGSCGCNPEALFWCGAAAAALTDALETAGFRVRLIATDPGSSHVYLFDNAGNKWDPTGKGQTCHYWQVPIMVIKNYDEPLRYGPAAFALCHAGFYRAVGFGMIAHGLWGYPPGLGAVESLSKKFLPQITTDSALLLPRAYTKEEALVTVSNAVMELEQLFDLASVVS